ncbi:MAG: tetratricopeptide repeat protein, partial [Nitrospirae bacterium]
MRSLIYFVVFVGSFCCLSAVFAAESGPEQYFDIGNGYFNEEQYDKAITAYSKALELAPGHVLASYNRGLSYYKTGRNDLAIADYSMAVSNGYAKPDIFSSRGIAYLKTGQYGLAAEDYTKVIAANPRFAE